ncbi:hypothetical protein X777_05113 [Ooceraea biroi]|uniref:Uncharacterized protein n=1 Tax=Ooceraea biroi TaxID=2015173 RepID=A0A026WFW4_OOCBI|nr:hypothetical protein X777_05113 [Ooceraea biroi]
MYLYLEMTVFKLTRVSGITDKLITEFKGALRMAKSLVVNAKGTASRKGATSNRERWRRSGFDDKKK